MTLALVKPGIPPLLEWIPQVSPDLGSGKPLIPWHMAEVAELFVQALATIRGERQQPLRALCTYPIRHFKTETFIHGVLWLLMHEPTLRIVIMTHSNDRAVTLGKRVKAIAARLPVGPVRGENVIANWKNSEGGGVLVMSVDSSEEGQDCHVLLCDDPIDEFGAFRADQRDAVDRAIDYYAARTVRQGARGPVLIVMSRQHPDDPVGRRLVRKATKWEMRHQPAIIDLGLPTERAFAPDVMSLDMLKEIRAENKETDPYERVFWSRYQGDPRVEGAVYYGEPARYDVLPAWPGYRDAVGIDISYTTGKASDWFGVVVARFYGGQCFLLNVIRYKPDPREVPSMLRAALAECAGGTAPIFSQMYGGDKGVAGRLQADHGISIIAPLTASVGNKHWRTMRTIKRWNDGKILVPANAPWAPAFIKRMKEYSGNQASDEDDESDALVSVCDAMLGLAGVAGPVSVGARRV